MQCSFPDSAKYLTIREPCDAAVLKATYGRVAQLFVPSCLCDKKGEFDKVFVLEAAGL